MGDKRVFERTFEFSVVRTRLAMVDAKEDMESGGDGVVVMVDVVQACLRSGSFLGCIGLESIRIGMSVICNLDLYLCTVWPLL